MRWFVLRPTLLLERTLYQNGRLVECIFALFAFSIIPQLAAFGNENPKDLFYAEPCDGCLFKPTL
jgi:hypothetical protein